MTKTGTSTPFDHVLEPVVEVLDQAIEVDCRKLFESQDIEGLRRMRRKLGESAPESIDLYID